MRQKHVILTLGRSGSNSLVDMINQSPNVLNYGEVLGEWNQLRKMQLRLGLFRGDDHAYLDALLTSNAFFHATNLRRSTTMLAAGKPSEIKSPRNISTIGFKEFSLNFRRYQVTDFLEKRPDIRVIGLLRRNVLARMISNEMLSATGVVSSRSSQKAPGRPKLRLDPEKVLTKLAIIEAENLDLDALLERVEPDRRLTLSYEELYSHPDNTMAAMRDVYGFLDVPTAQTRMRMSKLSSKDPLDSLENAGEIRERIEGTRFSCWL